MAPPECPFRNITCTPECPVYLAGKCSFKVLAESSQESNRVLNYIHNCIRDVASVVRARL